MTLNCSPTYQYRPNFIPSNTPCSAPSFTEKRSRLFAAGTFFRSKLIIGGREIQGLLCNDIAIKITKDLTSPSNNRRLVLEVYYKGVLVETYETFQDESGSPRCGNGLGISNLRSQVNSTSNYISMPSRGTDVEDLPPDDTDAACLSELTLTYLSGATGAPLDPAFVNTIRTGPERTVYIISTKEDNNGNPINPPPDEKIKQWNGYEWIPYIPNADCR